MTTRTARQDVWEGVTFQQSIKWSVLTCPRAGCHAVFAIPLAVLRRLQDEAGDCYCPNGHTMTWGESKVGRLEKELATAERQREAARRDASDQRLRTAAAERSARAHKGVATKRGNQLARVEAGVCPYCSREFKQLQRHMKTQHAGDQCERWAAAQAEKAQREG